MVAVGEFLKLDGPAVASTCAIGVGQAFAKPAAKDIEGALVLLCAAALAHKEHHCREGQAAGGAEQTAEFERGYRDGLHGYEYNPAGSSAAYGNAHDAGHVERANRATHRTQARSKGPNVPKQALQGCAKAVAANFGVGFT